MPNEIMTGIADADLPTVLSDYDYEGYAVIEKTKGPDGRWTLVARKNAANGAAQSPTSPDAIAQSAPQRPRLPSSVPAASQPLPPKPVLPASPVYSPVYRSPVRPPAGQMTLSPAGAALIKAFESCAIRTSDGEFRTYRDSVNVLTIGWGHTNSLGTRFGASAVWTQQQCDATFLSDMTHFETAVNELVKVQLNQDQFDALVSFCYNCGEGNLAKSTLLKKVNAKDFAGAAQEFKKWVKAGGRTLKGLVRRRNSESLMFQGIKDSNYDGIPD